MVGPPTPTGASRERSTTERKLLYIAGYGRSGSTVLDIALSCHPQVEGLGELAGVFTALAEGVDDPDRLSPLWRDLAATMPPAELRRAADVVARAERLLPGHALIRGSRLRARHRQSTGALLDELFERTGATVLVDSSKTSWLHTWRLPLLASIGPEIHVLVLVRDLEGVVGSVRRGHGETLEPQRFPILRAVLGWTLATGTAVLVGRLAAGPGRIRLIRHERFATDPGGHLLAAFDDLGVGDDRGAVADGLANGFRPRHQLLGNRVRGQRAVRIRSLIPADDQLPLLAGLAVRAASWLVEIVALRRVTPLNPRSADQAMVSRRSA